MSGLTRHQEPSYWDECNWNLVRWYKKGLFKRQQRKKQIRHSEQQSLSENLADPPPTQDKE